MMDFQDIRRIAWRTVAEFLGITEPTAALTGATSVKHLAGDGTWKTTPVGTVTSVAQTFTGGIVSVGGSPVTTSGTLALTVAGTSGGVVYFSSGTAWASSAALAANALVLGGGAGSAPATTTTGTGVVTALGVNVGSAGAFVTFNGAGGTPSSMTATNLTGTAAGLTAGTASAVALGGITGLGTNVATALAVSVGSAGAFVTFNGALGTPSSGTATNLTGTATGLSIGGNAATVTTNANLTGPITSSGNATSVAAQTGTGSVFVMQASPTLTGTMVADSGTFSGTLGVTGNTYSLTGATASLAASGTEDIFAPAGNSVYLVTVQGASNDAWRAVAFVMGATNDPNVTTSVNQYVTVTYSGANIRLTNTHGAAAQVLNWCVLKLR